MRKIIYGDIVVAASVIRCVEPYARSSFIDRLMHKAHCADKFRKRFGRWCAGMGDGSLVAACSGLPRETFDYLGDPDVADCMQLVFEAVKKWRDFQRSESSTRIASPGCSTGKTES